MPSQRTLWHSLAALACTACGTYLASRYLQGNGALTDALDWMEQVMLSIAPTATATATAMAMAMAMAMALILLS